MKQTQVSKHPSNDFFVTWYDRHGRDLPWRRDCVSPYQTLVTELLLHQTQAVQVKRVWSPFFERFPDVEALHEARQEAIFEEIGELGFGKQRTETLKSVAAHILEAESGTIPSQESRLLKLPGVGSYTAAAVLCFAFCQRVPLVDANVMRIAARLEGRCIERLDARRNTWVWEWARAHLPEARIKAHNYGILDFGAITCRPQSPNCTGCDLLEMCPCGQVVVGDDPPPYP